MTLTQSQALALLRGEATPSLPHTWHHGERHSVNFLLLNFPAYQGRTLISHVLHDADFQRNGNLSRHVNRFAGSMAAAKKKIVLSQNRAVQAVVQTLEDFFAQVAAAGVPHRLHFSVCTALESFIDWQHRWFDGNFVSVTGGKPCYGTWKRHIADNATRFVQHLKKRGLPCHEWPAADEWFLSQFPALEPDLGQHARSLLPSLFSQIGDTYGDDLIWLDTQGISEDKVALKLVKKALPGLDVVRLNPPRMASVSQICYF